MGRVKKPDVFINPDAVGNTTVDSIWHAIQPLDKIATDMERKWGVGRLPSLVTPETAAKFGAAKAKLDAALNSNDPDASVKKASVMVKGWTALDREATDMGHKPITAEVWVVVDDSGTSWTLAKSNADAHAYLHQGGVGRCYSAEEVVRILSAYEKSNSLVGAVKEAFKGSEISSINLRNSSVDDDIPF